MGAIFDWDGVVIDSSSHHEESWNRLAQETGKTLPEGHFKRGFGMKNEWIIPNLLGWTQDVQAISRLSLRKEELYRDVIQEKGIEPLPGIRELLELLASKGIPCAIGSSTHLLNITSTLKRLRLENHFHAIRSAEDVSKGKPDPEIFLKAAESIQRQPAGCVVFEDAQVGIDAAVAAQMKVVGVATTHPAAQLLRASQVVNRLTEVDWEKWLSLWPKP
jgi:beta-phosphoglucomutase family hydrolase